MSDTNNDYQKTLNLPKTDFSMRAGLAQKEPAYLEKWAKEGLYEQIKKESESNKTYILHDGPPYANGNIHIGHALNKILKDFIIKSKTMQGFNSFYVPGWDCHGLPIEHQLLKELKKKKSDVDCVEFRKSAHDYAMKYVEIQKEQFQRLGILGEWDNPYLTLDPNYEYWILKSLATLNEKGYVYRGLKPVNWCYNCETALAEAEVEYEDHVSKTVFVKFKITNQIQGLDPNENVSLLIWTTTPWTLIANVAVAIHPSFTYAKVKVNDELVIIEESLVDHVMQKAGITDYEIKDRLTAAQLVQATYQHPFDGNDQCRVVTADYVTKEDGTGLVHTAPGHGQDDFNTGLENDLDVKMPVNDRGVYSKGPYEGQFIFKANKQIVEDLQAKGALLISEDLNHSYPHCWRCKKPIIFRATKQWFLKIDHDGLRGRCKDAIKQDVTWIPESGQERILSMVTGRPDWCLSRQRYWGVPIPAIKSTVDGEYRLYSEVVNHFADIVKSEGTNAWFEKDIKDLIPEGFKCPETGATEFEKTFDILDVWFDSGVSHQAVVKSMLNQELPTEMYLEGSDQHRGWFQSSLIPAVAMEGKAPFKNVLTHGFVVDGQGRKMSKSLGNVISPLDIIKTSGADILRLWVAASSYNEDVRISKEILDRLVDAYRKIRNTFRYLLGNLNGFDPDQDMLPYEELLELDQWALYQLKQSIESIQANYEAFEFSKAYKGIYNFCNEDLSSFYLDILKDRLYTSATKSQERRSAQTVLFHILNHLVRTLAPILCFTAEEIFMAMPKTSDMKEAKNVHLLKWLEIPSNWQNEAIYGKFELLVHLRPYVLKALEEARRSKDIGSSLEAKVEFETASDRDFEYLQKNKEILPAAFIVSEVSLNRVETVEEGLGGDFVKTAIKIQKSSGKKCSRCWNYKSDVGGNAQHSSLCARCTEIVKELM